MTRLGTLMIIFIMSLSVVIMSGCHQQIGSYVAASSFSKNGFARNRKQMIRAHGTEINTWGFVDYSNIFADGVDGSHSHPTRWRFDLKAKPDDDAGSSFSIYLPKDDGRYRLLNTFIENEKKGRPTRVFVKGKIFTFDAPINFYLLTGLYMEVRSTLDIRLNP